MNYIYFISRACFTDSPATLPSEVNDCAANHLGVANGGVEEGPGDTAITLDSRSSESGQPLSPSYQLCINILIIY